MLLPAAITAYSLSVFIHVTAVVAGLGATFAESIAFPVAMRLDPKHLPYVHRLQLAINQRLATPALLIVLVTGVYQVAEGDWSFGDVWISGTFAIVIVIGGLLGGYFIPSDRRLAVQAEREVAAGTVPSEDYRRQASRQARFGALTGGLIIVAIFLMVTKPGV